MRTTLDLDKEAKKTVLKHAQLRGISQGKAASELIQRGARTRLTYHLVDGFPVFDVPDYFPTLTAEDIKKILDEE